ncbi:hypothetical protein WALSEDRAFT_55852 [Wallemia mellicola CBS 633.66]|uniref:Tetratricopeptide SHNi-TPR domain-containing protein n=2 Tax=Wallemia mellicola TaxID=1708541 RepID=I4YJ03_WALMC|nr:hypothetical protein WALSEDRAFT_55852 [Wallemia mellicola CBS 633.66]EIM23945.1 hypothetical protein WALSEDRAFT_55852 [Wallemia mellicola CBS 633.66]TIC27530.1 hypothetical protein E3Q11_02294 [Wallemia mellicola]TIC30202.1 hypothetical protein E3Q10_02175 [Wallemia mellicola]|eukprot:XP_006955784.1 hypothetical protein WALSEDRAFT_55852 [Wallemia mellicola CBS 633.66]
MSVESAGLLLKYGESLYLHAVSQSHVIGKSGDDAQEEAPASAEPSGSNTQQSGLIQLSDDEDDNDEEAPNDEQEGQDDDDDFGAAWEVADLAKVIYQKLEGDDNKLSLADSHMLLGDIALELETFDEAAAEYKNSLDIKQSILNEHSRVLAEAHFKLAISYELVPGHKKREDALVHVKQAKDVLQGRLDDLKKRVESGAPVEEAKEGDTPAIRERVERLAVDDANKHIQDISELIQDLTLKIDELEQPPPPSSEDPSKSTVDAIVAEMDKARQTISSDAPVNVLQPKKKQEKRKAEDDTDGDADKKAKMVTEEPKESENKAN